MKKTLLKDIFSIRKGKKVEPVEVPSDDTIRYIQIEDLRDNSNPKFCLPNDNYVIANKNHIIIAWDGANAGTVSYGLEGAIGSTLAILETREKNVYIPYVGKFLQSKNQYLRDTCTGATIPHISRKALENIVIPLPSVEMQKYISNTIDKANSLIEKRKAQIKALDQLPLSVFYDMFGDSFTNENKFPIQPLSDIATVRSSKRVFVKEIVDKGIPFYRGTEIGSLAIGENISPTLFITEEHYNSLKEASGVPKIGDLLMPSICPDGRIWQVKDNNPFYFKDGRVLWVHFNNNDVNTTYVQYALKDKFIRDYLNIASGTTFAELKIFSLKKVELMMPPLDLQNKFASIVEKIEAKKKVMQKSLLKLEDNYNSILQKSLNGDLFTEEKVSSL